MFDHPFPNYKGGPIQSGRITTPDQLCLDDLEECLGGRVVITVSLAAHRHPELMLAQDFPVFARTVLANAKSHLVWRNSVVFFDKTMYLNTNEGNNV
jgi:hypothetical protein